MDAIRLTGIRGYGYTGALPEEQILGQWFEVDLTLWLDLAQAGQSDRLEDTLDYRNVIVTVQQLIQTSQFSLIERLATAIVESLLQLNQIEQIHIRLTKLTPPIPDFSGQVMIELQRSKNSVSRDFK